MAWSKTTRATTDTVAPIAMQIATPMRVRTEHLMFTDELYISFVSGVKLGSGSSLQ